MMLRRRLPITCCSLALTVALTTPAVAQEDAGWGVGYSSSSTSTWLGYTATTVGVVLLVLWLISPDEGEEAMREYLQQNGSRVAQDVAVGGGQSLEELSGIFGVRPDHRAQFARALRATYPEVKVILAGEDVSREQAREFIRVVTQAMMQDEMLREDIRHWTSQAVAAR